MKHNFSLSLVFVSRIVIAFVFLFAALPVVGAKSPESTSVVETTQDAFSAAASVPGVRFVHTATAANTFGWRTVIDHPLTNNNPNAILFVTQNWNPGGVGSGEYNDHPIGVYYDIFRQKWIIFNQDAAAMPIGASFNVLIPSVDTSVFVHTATAANIVTNHTFINHPLANNNPNAILLVTQNSGPGIGVGVFNNHPIGVYYDDGEQKWAVFNQDHADMTLGAAFNVLIPPSGTDVFVHTATAGNIAYNHTFIDHPLTNKNPNAIVFVTQNWNPGGGLNGVYNDQPIGVYYDIFAEKWAIFNQNALSSMPIGADFNVLIPVTDSAVFVHTATDDNIAGNATYINHPLTNGNPNAILFVTQNWNPGGVGSGEYNDHPIGVYYASLSQKWVIFNQDAAPMPGGADFNVLIPSVDTSVFVHTATAANIVANNTVIDHPLSNNNPNAILLVTQNWNPSGVGGTYNNRPIGVWYSSVAQKWGIFNQDGDDMPPGAAFNVLIPPAGMDVFVHTATNTAVHYSYINHPLTNNNPNATVLVTQNWNPGGGEVGVYNDNPIGVFYSVSMQKWAIFNQDETANMPYGAAFNVFVVFNRIYLPIILR